MKTRCFVEAKFGWHFDNDDNKVHHIVLRIGILTITLQLSDRDRLQFIEALASDKTRQLSIDVISVSSSSLLMNLINKDFPILDEDNLGIHKVTVLEE